MSFTLQDPDLWENQHINYHWSLQQRGKSLPESTVTTLTLSQEAIRIRSAHSSLANRGHQELPDLRGSGIATPVCARGRQLTVVSKPDQLIHCCRTNLSCCLL